MHNPTDGVRRQLVSLFDAHGLMTIRVKLVAPDGFHHFNLEAFKYHIQLFEYQCQPLREVRRWIFNLGMLLSSLRHLQAVANGQNVPDNALQGKLSGVGHLHLGSFADIVHLGLGPQIAFLSFQKLLAQGLQFNG